MGSSKALVSNLIFHLHKRPIHLLQNHRMASWIKGTSGVLYPQPDLPGFQQSTSPHWVTCHWDQEAPGSCQVNPKGPGAVNLNCFYLSKGALCTFSSWSAVHWSAAADVHCYVTPSALQSLERTSENLWEGSSPSPRHRSMYSSWPTSRTTLPPCVLCLCFPKGSYPSIALLLNPWCIQQHPHDLDKITACNCTQSSNLSILPQGVYLCTGGLEWQSVLLQNRLLKASHKESQRMRTTHIKHQTSKAIQRIEQIRERKTWGHPRR